MNKNDLINYVANETGLKKSQACCAIDCCFEAISRSLSRQEDVRLVGFGTFTVSTRKATEGRNPRTGEKIRIPATRLPKFKAGKALKECVAA
ncbi:MAG: HU family DNA-binding protein [Alphaproteobacteria bacterium]|nr:HU family DNA-binding protein [Alphaproteobacteria bacterium]